MKNNKKTFIKGIKSIFSILFLVVGVTFLSFSILHIAPGDPAETILTQNGYLPTEEEVEALREEMGLNRPLIEQYGSWIAGILQGDFGDSMIDQKPIAPKLLRGLKYSASLAAFSLLLGIVISFPVGIYTAVKKDKLFDRITNAIVFLRLSAPSFLVALGLLYVFAYKFKWVNISAKDSGFAGIILPVLTLGTGVAVKLIRQIRMLVLQELSSAYVAGARSRGLSEMKILFGHVLKNTMLPIITMLAGQFGALIGGTAITEIIFSWPGIGQMVMEAIKGRDYTIVQSFVLVTSMIYCIIYGLTEISYGVLDPRVKYAEGSHSK